MEVGIWMEGGRWMDGYMIAGVEPATDGEIQTKGRNRHVFQIFCGRREVCCTSLDPELERAVGVIYIGRRYYNSFRFQMHDTIRQV